MNSSSEAVVGQLWKGSTGLSGSFEKTAIWMGLHVAITSRMVVIGQSSIAIPQLEQKKPLSSQVLLQSVSTKFSEHIHTHTPSLDQAVISTGTFHS